MAGITDLATAIFPTGTVTRDADGVYRYTLSDRDIAKARSAILGVLPDGSSSGRPLFRISRLDEAVVPAVLQRFGLPLAVGVLGVAALGYWAGKKRFL